MLEGLAVLPLKRQAYRGRHISEFDLDAALARRPALILMDELAPVSYTHLNRALALES